MKSLKLATLLLLLSAIFMSCEKQEFFKSKSGIEKQLQHNWHRVQLSINDSPTEVWEFHSGNVTITDGTTSSFTGNYSVKTTLTRVYVTTKNFTTGGIYYNDAKWTVIKLDNDVLVMVAENSQGGGMMEREFIRQ